MSAAFMLLQIFLGFLFTDSLLILSGAMKSWSFAV